VQREREVEQIPTYTLEASFSELLTAFRFVPFGNPGSDAESLGNKIDIWKKIVDVQQHFNDLEMRIRNFAITLLGVLFGAAGLSLSRDITIQFGRLDVPVGVVLLLAALFTWAAFYFMDRHWYHRLLYGAVKHAEKVENAIKGQIPEIALTDSIRKESAIKFLGLKVRSTGKIDLFYGVGAGAIVLTIAILLLTAEIAPKSGGGQAAKPGAASDQVEVEDQRGPAEPRAMP
jgi:hypothetical protein